MRSRPWDTRGPRGPQEGGPQNWNGQKFRPGSGRWANAGGQHREKYSLYHRKKKDGLTGLDLQYYHTMDANGYWAMKAAEEGVLSPNQMKQLWDVESTRKRAIANDGLRSEVCALRRRCEGVACLR